MKKIQQLWDKFIHNKVLVLFCLPFYSIGAVTLIFLFADKILIHWFTFIGMMWPMNAMITIMISFGTILIVVFGTASIIANKTFNIDK